MKKNTFIIILFVIIISCNSKNETKSIEDDSYNSNSKTIDSISLRRSIEDSIINNLFFSDFFESRISESPHLPDSIISNHKKLYQFYRFTYIPSFIPDKFHGYDSVSYVFKGFGASKVRLCNYSRDLKRISKIQFKYTHDFIKKVFSGYIINKHKQDFIDKQELSKCWDFDRQGSLNDFWDDMAEQVLYEHPDDCRGEPLSTYFLVQRVWFSEEYTLFVFEVSDGSGDPYGINIMCTYNHEGDCIDCIETGQSIDRSDDVAVAYSYSYFDYKGFYHIIRVKIDTDNVQWFKEADEEWTNEDFRIKRWNKMTTYNEITEHYKYKLTDDGRFILIKKDKRRLSKPIFE